MFGPSKEVKEKMEQIRTSVEKNVEKYKSFGSSHFENSELIDLIQEFRDKEHPVLEVSILDAGLKPREKLKKLGYLWMDDILEDKFLKKIAVHFFPKEFSYDKHQAELWNQLNFDDELILYNCTGYPDETGFVLTNKNFHLSFRPSATGFFDDAVGYKSWKIEDITQISMKSRLIHHKVSVNNSHRGNVSLLPDGRFTRMAQIIDEYVKGGYDGKVQVNVSGTSSNNPEESAIDKLKKLKDLLDAGVITEEEFNAKKEKLLSEI